MPCGRFLTAGPGERADFRQRYGGLMGNRVGKSLAVYPQQRGSGLCAGAGHGADTGTSAELHGKRSAGRFRRAGVRLDPCKGVR